MKYILLIPKTSLRDDKPIISLMEGFWNGIGFVFSDEKERYVRDLIDPKKIKHLIYLEWNGNFGEYRQFCQEDKDYMEITGLKIRRHALRILEEINEQ